MVWKLLVAALIVLALLIAVAAVYRFFVFRGSGMPIVFRMCGRQGQLGQWSHGIMRFTEDSGQLVKLFSIRPRFDVELDRASIHLDASRKPQTSGELAVLEPGELVVSFEADDRRGRKVSGDFGLDTQTHAAMRSWVEACSIQSVKRRRARFY